MREQTRNSADRSRGQRLQFCLSLYLQMLRNRRVSGEGRLGLNRPLVPPRLMPPHRRGDADTEALRRLIPCRSRVNRFNHSRAQVRRIRSGHGSLTKPNHPPRLRPSARLGNPDSDPTETALDGVVVRDPAFQEWLATERGRLREVLIGVLSRLLAHLTGTEAIVLANR